MALKRLIKCYEFSKRLRPELTFSDKDKIRLNDDNKLDQALTLKIPFTTDLDAVVETPVFSPKGLKKWLGFEALEETPTNTSVGYRLVHDGNEVYWDGSVWSPATTDAHWSPQADIRDNIQSLVLSGFDLTIKVNLRTTDGKNTPRVKWIKILVLIDIEPWDDLIYDTIISSMRASLRATTVIEAAVVSTTATLDLAGDYKLENVGYNFTDVSAVYDLTTDPNKFINLKDSYVPGVLRPDGTTEDGQINLTSAIPAGNIARIEMEYVPEIAVFTGQDYYEVERLPAIVFERIFEVKLNNKTGQELNDGEGDSVRDIANGVAVYVPRPRQSTVRFNYAVHASPTDLHRLSDSIDRWLSNNIKIKTNAFDNLVTIDPVQEIDTGNSVNMDDVVVTTGSFQLQGVPFFVKDSKDLDLIETVNATYTPV